MDKVVISKCHCGSVELELTLPNGFENLRRCNCSICSRRNAVVASVTIDNLEVVKGETEGKTSQKGTDNSDSSIAAMVVEFNAPEFTEIDGVQRTNFAGLLKIAKERAIELSEQQDAKGRLIGYVDSTRASPNDFDWVHIEFETSYDGGISVLRYFFPVGDFEHATEDELENMLEDNWYLKPYLRETGLKDLHKFWDKEKSQMVYELRYVLTDVDYPSAISTWWYRIATENDSVDENIRYRLKRERYAIEAMEG